MADETFEIGFSVTGQGDASKAFEDLKLAEMEAKEEAAKLSAELKKLKESGEGTAEEIEATARAMIRAKQAAAQYGADARRAGTQVQAAARQTQQVTRSLDTQTRSSALAARGFQSTSSAAAQLGSALGSVTPALGSVGTSIASVAGNLGALGASFGPIGLGIGAVTGAISLARAAFDSLDDPLRRIQQRHRDHAAEVRENATQYQRLLRNVRGSREQFDLLFRNQGENAVQASEDRVTAARQQIEDLEVQLRRVEQRVGERSRGQTTQYNVPGLGDFEVSGDAVAANPEVRRLQRQLEVARDRLTRMELSRSTTEGRTEAAAVDEAQEEFNRRDRRDRERAHQQAEHARQERERRLQQQKEQAIRLEREAARTLDAPAEAAEVQALADAWGRVADVFRELDETGGVDLLGPVRTEIEQTLALRDQAHDEQIRAQQANVRERGRVEGEWLEQYREMVESLSGLDDESQRNVQRSLRARQDDHAAYLQALREMEASHTQWTAEELQRRTDIIREQLSMQRGLHEQQEEQVRQIEEQMWRSTAGAVTDAMGEMYGFLIQGGDLSGDAFMAMLDKFLESTSIQYTITALAQATEAVIAAASLNPAKAAAHGTAAGMAAAVAAATGIGGAVINVPSVGAASNAPAQAQHGAPGGGPTTVHVNLYAPQAVFTEAERGQLINDSMREARRQLGRG